MNTIDNRRKAMLFAILAVFFAASVAPLAASKSIPHVSIVVPLVVMGVCLLAAGYYAGLARGDR